MGPVRKEPSRPSRGSTGTTNTKASTGVSAAARLCLIRPRSTTPGQAGPASGSRSIRRTSAPRLTAACGCPVPRSSAAPAMLIWDTCSTTDPLPRVCVTASTRRPLRSKRNPQTATIPAAKKRTLIERVVAPSGRIRCTMRPRRSTASGDRAAYSSIVLSTGVWLMLEGPQVFVDIDTQRDFLEPTGALFVPGSTAIVPHLARLTRFASDQRIPILATACAHTPDDPELKTFPPHCMIGTAGQERVEATCCGKSLIFDDQAQVSGTIPPHLTLLKRQYDLFTHPRADELIALYAADRPVFVVYGVATDYCVAAAVHGLLARHCRIALVVDAIRAIDNEAEAGILTEFARRGVLLTMTDFICDPGTRVPLD